jgi:hypothetical protein
MSPDAVARCTKRWLKALNERTRNSPLSGEATQLASRRDPELVRKGWANLHAARNEARKD